MTWRKRLLILACAAVLVLGPALAGTARADSVTIYLMAENNKMVDLPVEAMPCWISGQMYIPCTAFDWSVTGVNLGVSYGQIREDGKSLLTLYSLSDTVTFDLNAGTCTDRQGEPVGMRAAYRNGLVFVPAAAVCSYFGLRYSYTPTDYGNLVRIISGTGSLSDEQFIEYAESSMRTRYNNLLKQLEPAAQPSAQPSQPMATPRPSPGQSEQPEHMVTVYLGVLCAGDQGWVMADQLESEGVRALFLFRPEDVADSGELIRRLAGSGHAVGLSITGTTLAQAKEQLEEGAALLEQVARLPVHTVYLESGESELSAALEEGGWACWEPRLDYTGDQRTQSALGAALFNALDDRSGVARVMVEDGDGEAVGRALSRLDRDECVFRLPAETLL